MKDISVEIQCFQIVHQHFFVSSRKNNVLSIVLIIGNYQQSTVSTFSVISHQIGLFFFVWDNFAVYNHIFVFRILAEGDQLFVPVIHGIRAVRLFSGIDIGIIRIHFQPWGSCGKSCVSSCILLEWSTGIVTAVRNNRFESSFRSQSGIQCYLILIEGTAVIDLIDGVESNVCHTQFLTLVDERQSAEHEVDSRKHFLAGIIYIAFRDIVFYPQLGVKLCSMAGGGVQKIYMVFFKRTVPAGQVRQ